MTPSATLENIAVLIFDLDGTLVDSMDDLAVSVNLTRGDYGMPPLTRAEVAANVGDGSEVLVRACVPVPENQIDEACRRYLAHYNEHLLDNTHLNPGVSAVLEHFADRQLAVVTNKLEQESRRLLVGLNILHCFGYVVGGDTFARKKPDPMQISGVLQRFRCAPERCVMIGDSINDVRAGYAAGVHTIGYTNGVEDPEALHREAPNLIIDRMDQLITLIH